MERGTRLRRTCSLPSPSTWYERVKERRPAPVLATVAAVLLAVSACQYGTQQAAPAPEPVPQPPSRADEPNTMDGVYTVAQAERGLQVFNRICAECHLAEDWTQQAFLDRWEELSVFRLWYWIYERMPHGNPGSLTREQVTDALTYIFQLNGLPPGGMELGTDDDSIDDYWIIWPEAGD